jgi:hypothetical protein
MYEGIYGLFESFMKNINGNLSHANARKVQKPISIANQQLCKI